MCHFPPHNTKLDKIPDGNHVGSTVLRKFLEQTKSFQVVVGGHIHESQNHERINGIDCFNTGPFMEGKALTITIKDQVLEGYRFILGN